MDVIFELEGGRPSFFIEVGFFDTILDMKEKIEKYQGIPIPKQTLVLKGQVLEDDHDVAYCIKYCEFLQDSRIQLIFAEDPIIIEDTKKIQLKIKISTSSYSKAHLSIEMDSNDTVATLKEKIQEKESIQVNRLALHYRGKELQDSLLLCDYEVFDNSEIDVFLRPLPPSGGGGSKKLILTVLSMCESKKIAVDVNASDNVGCDERPQVVSLDKVILSELFRGRVTSG